MPKPALHRFGATQVPVVMVDGLGPSPADVAAMAQALAPFPPAGLHYPGLRRTITSADTAAHAYVTALLRTAAPYLAGAFAFDGFDLIDASLSIVTTPAHALDAVQRAPHFDDVAPDVYAVLHYISDTPGTAFYRHRASGIECVTPASVDGFVAQSRRETPPDGYVTGSNAHYECIGHVAGVAGRLVAYPARVLHSGIIPAGFAGDADPSRGRLTANIFVRG